MKIGEVFDESFLFIDGFSFLSVFYKLLIFMDIYCVLCMFRSFVGCKNFFWVVIEWFRVFGNNFYGNFIFFEMKIEDLDY